MKILWLDHVARAGRYDKWLHIDFAKKIRGNGAEVVFYGPRMHEVEYDYTPIKYDHDITMEELVDKLAVDTIVLNTKAAIYENYFPRLIYPNRADEGRVWLPQGFAEIKIPKICIEEDYHYEYSDEWYEEMGFSVILQKHYSQSLRKMVVPVIFFPFSVDLDVFHPPRRESRFNRICIASIATPSMYPFRYRAMAALQKEDMIDCFIERQKIGQKYVNCLQQYTCHLSGGSRYNLSPAKTFEIIASGSVLLTNQFMGLEKLLPEGSYVTYKNDISDIIDRAREITYSSNYRKHIIEKGIECVKKYHSHRVRIKQLIDIIQRYL